MPSSNRLAASLSPAAMIVAILALVMAAAGAGYAAGKIGTSDLKDNAVTSPKVKNGTLTANDMVKEKKYTKISAPGGPSFSDGGQGDCVWQSAASIIPGLGDPSYQVDRFGTVHLAGVAVGSNGAGGDATCDYTSESEDAVVTVLPKSLRPATTQIIPAGSYTLIIVGPTPLSSGSLTLVPGTVYWSGPASYGILFDGISYLPAGSKLAATRPTSEKLTPQGRTLLRHLGMN